MPDGAWCIIRAIISVSRGFLTQNHSHAEEESIPRQEPNRTTLPRPPLCVPGAALSSPDLCCYLLLLMENFMKQRLNFTTKPKRVEASALRRGEKKKKEKKGGRRHHKTDLDRMQQRQASAASQSATDLGCETWADWMYEFPKFVCLYCACVFGF